MSPQLRNGPDAAAPPLGGRLCGSSVPPLVQTSDNDLFVQFVSDGSNEGSGFQLTFEAHSQGNAADPAGTGEKLQLRRRRMLVYGVSGPEQ